MWVTVVAGSITALMAIPPLLMPDMSTGEIAYFVLYIVLTVVVVFLVRGELGRTRGQARSKTVRGRGLAF
ncbi:hypothetical protein [Actinomycetospora sp.]|jgi:hypothetical protein|uniref:hypothetical protein n=1 Tax=Actinomycetospora sp. TaxID=1872135 RepID=UPI002F3FAB0D